MNVSEWEIRRLEADIARLQDEVRVWRDLCQEAAVEIERHWAAHCREDGHGPVGLLRKLKGKPSSAASTEYFNIARSIEGFHE